MVYNIKPMLGEDDRAFYKRCKKEKSGTWSDYELTHKSFSPALSDYVFKHKPIGWIFVPILSFITLGAYFSYDGLLAFLLLSPFVAAITMIAYGYSVRKYAKKCLEYGEEIGLTMEDPEMQRLQEKYRKGSLWLTSGALSGMGIFKDYKRGVKNIYSNKGDRSY